MILAPFQNELHLDINETDGWKFPHALYIAVSRTFYWYHKKPIKFTRSVKTSVTTGAGCILVPRATRLKMSVFLKETGGGGGGGGPSGEEKECCVAQFVSVCCFFVHRLLPYRQKDNPLQ